MIYILIVFSLFLPSKQDSTDINHSEQLSGLDLDFFKHMTHKILLDIWTPEVKGLREFITLIGLGWEFIVWPIG
jgi:hypothetical protein